MARNDCGGVLASCQARIALAAASQDAGTYVTSESPNELATQASYLGGAFQMSSPLSQVTAKLEQAFHQVCF